ncbi:MAG TPA: nitroreductase family protein [Lachnospiraceae bacterium]|nr:nitroreductase family protein [Lachnospiraceae bacterium]
MTELEAIKARHAVRNYLDKPIEVDIVDELRCEISRCNEKGKLHLQLITEESGAFKTIIPAFGRFKGVKNYIALVIKKGKENYEACGYYGAKIMIKAQQLGLNTCWVIGSYNRNGTTADVAAGEELIGVIAIGYGATNGQAHRSKNLEAVCKPCAKDWFINGVKAALLAPTGLNKQHFMIEANENDTTVTFRATDDKPMTQIDLGIVKYHFEVASKLTADTLYSIHSL